MKNNDINKCTKRGCKACSSIKVLQTIVDSKSFTI